MSKRKQKTDVTRTTLRNVRRQRELERKLFEIEKQWHAELKNITRQKLELSRELLRLNKSYFNVDYLTDEMGADDIREYYDQTYNNVRNRKVIINDKYDFKKDQIEKKPLHFPPILGYGHKRPTEIKRSSGGSSFYALTLGKGNTRMGSSSSETNIFKSTRRMSIPTGRNYGTQLRTTVSLPDLSINQSNRAYPHPLSQGQRSSFEMQSKSRVAWESNASRSVAQSLPSISEY